MYGRIRFTVAADIPHIGVHDIIMSFEILLNLVPAEGNFVNLSITHCITRINNFCERCLDVQEHKLNEYRGLSRVAGGIDSSVVLLFPVVDDRHSIGNQAKLDFI